MRSSGLAMALGVLAAWSGSARAQDRFPTMPSQQGVMLCGSCRAPSAIPSRATIAPPAEPGERLAIAGTVYQPDGVTPAPDVTIFVYHTDAKGHYNSPDDALNPRLYGWVRTDKQGRYDFRTIKPAPYPQVTTPAHIHVHVYGPGRPEWFIPEFWFDGDPLIPSGDRDLPARLGRFSPVVRLTKEGEGWKGERDIRLDAPRAVGTRRRLGVRTARAVVVESQYVRPNPYGNSGS